MTRIQWAKYLPKTAKNKSVALKIQIWIMTWIRIRIHLFSSAYPRSGSTSKLDGSYVLVRMGEDKVLEESYK